MSYFRLDLGRCMALALAIFHTVVVVQVKCGSVCFAPRHEDYMLTKRLTKSVPDTQMQEICYDLQLFHVVDASDDTGVQCGKQYFTASLRLGAGWFHSFKQIPKDSELLDMQVSFEPSYVFENIKPRFRPIIVTAENVELNSLAGFWVEICCRGWDFDLDSDPLKVIKYRKISENAPEGVLFLPTDKAEEEEPVKLNIPGNGTVQVRNCSSGGSGCSVQTSGDNFSSSVTVQGSGSAQLVTQHNG